MFFKKKPNAPASTKAADGRGQYRKRNSKAQPLEVQLSVTGWPPLHVELLDLSVRGVGVRVPFSQDRNLKVDGVVELSIGAMMRTDIVTPARVTSVAPEGESYVRYGLEFLNVGNLYSQLDAFYSRHFNRRSSLRVLPALDRKIHAQLRWNGGELRVQVFDLSDSGLGVVLSKDSAARTAEVPGFDIEFELPGAATSIRGSAQACHRSPLNQGILLGLKFDLETSGGLREHVAEIRRFVEQRSAEVALWEKSWG